MARSVGPKADKHKVRDRAREAAALSGPLLKPPALPGDIYPGSALTWRVQRSQLIMLCDLQSLLNLVSGCGKWPDERQRLLVPGIIWPLPLFQRPSSVSAMAPLRHRFTCGRREGWFPTMFSIELVQASERLSWAAGRGG